MDRLTHNTSAHCHTGAALVTVLAVVAFVATLVVVFTTVTQLDRQSASNYIARESADLMVQEAVALVGAKLLTAYTPPHMVIATMPGRVVYNPGDNKPVQTVALSSGVDAGTTGGVYAGANLNRISRSIDGERIIDPNGQDMLLSWIYVREDGSRTAGGAPTANPNNPVVGRYAFWTDDESSRINFNTAWKRRTGTFSLADSTLINLRALDDKMTQTDADTLFDATKQTPLMTPLEEARVIPALADVFSQNRFNTTHRSHDMDLNPFGEPKIVLTTRADKAGGQPFIDILTDGTGLDPGEIASIDGAKYKETVEKIYTLLKREGWPYVEADNGEKQSVVARYGANEWAVQFAMDIIEYVRAAESALPIVQPVRGRAMSFTGDEVDFRFGQSGAFQANAFMGNSRSPRITEVGIR